MSKQFLAARLNIEFCPIGQIAFDNIMTDAALELYNYIKSFARIEQLIENGEAEGLHLECKAPSAPQLSKDLKAHLAKALSAFSNSAGGVILWGVSTTRQSHSQLDVLSQIEPIGNVYNFSQQIKRAAPALTTPPVVNFKSKVLKRKPSDSRGIVIAYVPQGSGDPLQSTDDELFYFRSGDEFVRAPYEMIKRLFAASESPDLHPLLASDLVSLTQEDAWKIPIVLTNLSSSAARQIAVTVSIQNLEWIEQVKTASPVRDVSYINPQHKIFVAEPPQLIFRGFDTVVGFFQVKMKKSKRRLDLKIELFADKMRARRYNISVHLAKKKFTIKSSAMHFLY